jgi:hypothetical protein
MGCGPSHQHPSRPSEAPPIVLASLDDDFPSMRAEPGSFGRMRGRDDGPRVRSSEEEKEEVGRLLRLSDVRRHDDEARVHANASSGTRLCTPGTTSPRDSTGWRSSSRGCSETSFQRLGARAELVACA